MSEGVTGSEGAGGRLIRVGAVGIVVVLGWLDLRCVLFGGLERYD